MISYRLLDVCKNLEFQATSEHPNRMNFSGVLVRLGEPSTKAPHGSRGHKIEIPVAVARKALSTLVGMGLNYAENLDTHSPQNKVGVIEKAWIDGNDLKISGTIWKKDFPDAVKDLSKAHLGMSFEASNIEVEDEHAPIWVIKNLCFTGATILYKTAAAYYKTSAKALAASAENQWPRLIKIKNGGKDMAKPNATKHADKKKKIAASSSEDALVRAFTTALQPLVTEVKKNSTFLQNMQAAFEEMLEASDEENEGGETSAEIDEPQMTSKRVKAAKKKKDEDEDEDEDDDKDEDEDDDEDDDVDSEADDEDELEDMGEDEDDDDVEKSGELNKDANTNKGRGAPSKPAGRKDGSIDSSALHRRVARLTASNAELTRKLNQMQKKLTASAKQLEAASEKTERRSSVAPTLANTLSKYNIDAQAMADAGEKITVSEFDAVLNNTPNIDSVSRVDLKNQMIRAGLMETGELRRQ